MELNDDIRAAIGTAKQITELATYSKVAISSIDKVCEHLFSDSLSIGDKKKLTEARSVLFSLVKDGTPYQIERSIINS